MHNILNVIWLKEKEGNDMNILLINAFKKPKYFFMWKIIEKCIV
jgi:hypothetical protein